MMDNIINNKIFLEMMEARHNWLHSRLDSQDWSKYWDRYNELYHELTLQIGIYEIDELMKAYFNLSS